MKIIEFVSVFLIFILTPSFALVTWTNTYGTPQDDYAYSLALTSDGGYIVVGRTSVGFYDIYTVRLSPYGDTLWTRTYGNPTDDNCSSVKQTPDAGFVLAGYTEYGTFAPYAYLLKLDSAGDTLWTHTYGGIGNDGARSVCLTYDGGYAIAGWTTSFGVMSWSLYLVRTDSLGDTLWTRYYGRDLATEYAYDIEQTTDSGFIMAGYTDDGYDEDMYLIKVDKSGVPEWTGTYGGSGDERARAVTPAYDGGYVLIGYSNSFGDGDYEVYYLKADSSGDSLWSRTFSTIYNDYGYDLVQTADSGFILTGYGDTPGRWYDALLLKTDRYGNEEWHRYFGGAFEEYAYSVTQTFDGGYALAGWTNSFGEGYNDFYVIKTDTMGLIGVPNHLAILVNTTHEDRHYEALRKAYVASRQRGFAREQLFILHHTANCDVDGWGGNDVNALATGPNLNDAIRVWAVSRADSATKLYLFFTDHGNVDWYPLVITPGDTGLTSPELNAHLNFYDNATHAESIYVIFNACFSGSFIDELSDPGRIIMCSTNDSLNTWYLPNGYAYFGHQIWNKLAFGYDFAATFNWIAAWAAEWYWLVHQIPWLDDNGDGIGHEEPLPNGGDGDYAAGISWGAKNSSASKEAPETPEIISFIADTLTSPDTIFFELETYTEVESCHVFVIRTDSTYEACPGMEGVVEAPVVTLQSIDGYNFEGFITRREIRGNVVFVAGVKSAPEPGMPFGDISYPVNAGFEYAGIRDNILIPDELDINIYPNPFNSTCRITSPVGSRIEIHDLNGRMVCSVNSTGRIAGDGSYVWTPGTTLPSGIYLIRISNARSTVIRKIIYMK